MRAESFDLQDFLDEILLLRGSNAATVKDLTVLKCLGFHVVRLMLLAALPCGS